MRVGKQVRDSSEPDLYQSPGQLGQTLTRLCGATSRSSSAHIVPTKVILGSARIEPVTQALEQVTRNAPCTGVSNACSSP